MTYRKSIVVGILVVVQSIFAIPMATSIKVKLYVNEGLLKGAQDLSVYLYNEDKETIWSESHSGIQFNDGIGSIPLGQSVPFPPKESLEAIRLFIGIKLDSPLYEEEPETILELVSSGFSLMAHEAYTVNWDTIYNKPVLQQLEGTLNVTAQIEDASIPLSKLDSTDFYGNGSQLTHLTASALTGIVPTASMPENAIYNRHIGVDAAIDPSKVALTKEYLVSLGIPSKDTTVSSYDIIQTGLSYGFTVSRNIETYVQTVLETTRFSDLVQRDLESEGHVLTIENQSNNNDTESGLVLSANKGLLSGVVKTVKDENAYQYMVMGSESDHDVVFIREGDPVLVFNSEGALFSTPISADQGIVGDGSQLHSISSSALLGTIDVERFPTGVFSDHHFSSQAQIAYDKLDIEDEMISLIKDTVHHDAYQTDSAVQASIDTALEAIKYQDNLETELETSKLFRVPHSMAVMVESDTAMTFYSGYVSVATPLRLEQGIIGDGSGLTHITASTLKGLIPTSSIPETWITNEHLSTDAGITYDKLNIQEALVQQIQSTVKEEGYQTENDVDLTITTALQNVDYKTALESSLTQDTGVLAIRNDSINNDTYAGVAFSSNKGNVKGAIYTVKDSSADQYMSLGTETNHDVLVVRNNMPVLTFSQQSAQITKPLIVEQGISGNGSLLTDLSAAQVKGVLSGAVLPQQAITNDHIAIGANISYNKLNIKQDIISQIQTTVADEGYQKEDDINAAINTALQTINYHDEVETAINNSDSSLDVFNHSINNSTSSGITVKANNGAVSGYFKAIKDSDGVQKVDIGSDSDHDMVLSRAGDAIMTLSETEVRVAQPLRVVQGIVGNGSGLEQLTASALTGTVSAERLPLAFITDAHFKDALDQVYIKKNLTTDHITSGLFGSNRIASGAIANAHIASDAGITYDKLDISDDIIAQIKATVAEDNYQTETDVNASISTALTAINYHEKIESALSSEGTLDLTSPLIFNIDSTKTMTVDKANTTFSTPVVLSSGISGNGSGLTSLTASNLSGTIPVASIPASSISNSHITGTIDSSHIATNLSTSHISSGTFGSDRIASGALSNSHIAANAGITYDKLDIEEEIVAQIRETVSGDNYQTGTAVDASITTALNAINYHDKVETAINATDSSLDLSNTSINNDTDSGITFKANNGVLNGFVKAVKDVNGIQSIQLGSISNHNVILSRNGDDVLTLHANDATFATPVILENGISGNGSGLTSLTASNLSGAIPVSSIPASSISNSHIASNAGITYDKLDISDEIIDQIKTTVSEDNYQTETDVNASISTALTAIKYHDKIESALSSEGTLDLTSSLIFNIDSTKTMTVAKANTTFSTPVVLSNGISGNGSGLTSLTASNLSGTIPVASIPASSISNSHITGTIDSSHIASNLSTSHIASGTFGSDRISSGSLSNSHIASDAGITYGKLDIEDEIIAQIKETVSGDDYQTGTAVNTSITTALNAINYHDKVESAINASDSSLDLSNASINNDTNSGITFKANNGALNGFVKAVKDTNGIQSIQLGSISNHNVILSRNGDDVLTLHSNDATFATPVILENGISGNGSGLTSLTASNLSGTIPASTLPTAVLSNSHIATNAGITYDKLDISDEIIAQIKETVTAEGYQKSADTTSSISTALNAINYHDKVESAINATDSSLDLSNSSINNDTNSGITFKANNGALNGFVKAVKDINGTQSIQLGSISNHNVILSRNGDDVLTLHANDATFATPVILEDGISGNGSGLTNLTASQLIGTIPTSTLPSSAISNSHIASNAGITYNKLDISDEIIAQIRSTVSGDDYQTGTNVTTAISSALTAINYHDKIESALSSDGTLDLTSSLLFTIDSTQTITVAKANTTFATPVVLENGISGNGSGLTSLTASNLSGTIPVASIPASSISNSHITGTIDSSHIASNLSTSHISSGTFGSDRIASGSLSNSHIASNAGITYSKLDIEEEIIAQIRETVSDDNYQTGTAVDASITTALNAINYHDKVETAINATDSSLDLSNASINNDTNSGITFKANNGALNGFVKAVKDVNGTQSIQLGSISNHNVILSRNGDDVLTLHSNDATFETPVILENGISGNGSGLTNLTASNLSGTIPVSSIPASSISNSHISGTIDSSHIATNLSTSHISSGTFGSSRISSGSLSNLHIASNAGITYDKLDISDEIINQIRSTVAGDNYQTGTAVATSISTALTGIDYHDEIESALSSNGTLDLTSSLIFNIDSTKTITVSKANTTFSTPVVLSNGISGNGSGLTSLTASNLSGTIPVASIPAASISNSHITGTIDSSHIASNLSTAHISSGTFSGARIGSGVITNAHISSSAGITYSKLDIQDEVIAQIRTTVAGDDYQTGDEVANTISTALSDINYHDKVETAINATDASLDLSNLSINNNTDSGITFKANNGALNGFVKAVKDENGIQSIQLGSISNHNVILSRNGDDILTLKSDNATLDTPLVLNDGIYGNGSGLTSLTASNLLGTIPVASIPASSISNSHISGTIDSSHIATNLSASHISSGTFSGSRIASGAISNSHIASTAGITYNKLDIENELIAQIRETVSGDNYQTGTAVASSITSALNAINYHDKVESAINATDASLDLKNSSINNNTESGITFKANNGAVQGFVKAVKNENAIQTIQVGSNSNHDVVLSRYGTDILTLKSTSATFATPVVLENGISGNGSGLTSLTASNLSGTIPVASIPASSISNGHISGTIDGSHIASNLSTSHISSGTFSGARIASGAISNAHLSSTAGITYNKLDIEDELVAQIRETVSGDNYQTGTAVASSITTALNGINYHDNVESAINAKDATLDLSNSSISNNTSSGIQFNANNNAVKGYLKSKKDGAGTQVVELGSNSNHDVVLARNGATRMTLKTNDVTFATPVVLSNGISGNGSGLTSLNASNISSGTINNSRLNSATTAQAGITQLTDSYSGTSSTLAASQKAVKNALDSLGSMAIQNNNAVNIDGGTVEGLSMIKSTQGEIETLKVTSIVVSGNATIDGDVDATNLTVDTITYKTLVQDPSSIKDSDEAIEFVQPLRAPNPMVDTYLSGSSRGNWVTATWVKNTFHIGNMISQTNATQLKIPVTGVYLVKINIQIGGNCESYLKIYKEDGSVRTTLATTAHNGSSSAPDHVISINEPYYLIAGDYISFDFYSRSVHSNNITTTLSSADYMKIMYITSSDTD